MDPTKADAAADAALREVVAETAGKTPLVGALLKWAILHRRWAWLVAAAGALLLFVVYPLAVPLIAAALVSCPKSVDGAIDPACRFLELRTWYADTVRDAFQIDRSARRLARAAVDDTHQRLDYFQVLEVRGAHDEGREWTISARAPQRVILRIDRPPIFRTSDLQRCPIPVSLARSGTVLYRLTVGDSMTKEVRSETPAPLQLDAEAWKRMAPHIEDGRVSVRLDPSPQLLQPVLAVGESETCRFEVTMRITVEVFKDQAAAPTMGGMK